MYIIKTPIIVYDAVYYVNVIRASMYRVCTYNIIYDYYYYYYLRRHRLSSTVAILQLK